MDRGVDRKGPCKWHKNQSPSWLLNGKGIRKLSWPRNSWHWVSPFTQRQFVVRGCVTNDRREYCRCAFSPKLCLGEFYITQRYQTDKSKNFSNLCVSLPCTRNIGDLKSYWLYVSASDVFGRSTLCFARECFPRWAWRGGEDKVRSHRRRGCCPQGDLVLS